MKNLIIASIIVLFSTSVFAGSCPMMAKQVDDKIKQAQELRDTAMQHMIVVITQSLKSYLMKRLNFLKARID